MDREIELRLVGRLRDGDAAAFDEVHAAFNARLYNFLVRLSNRRDVAEDLLEETWLRLVVHAQRLQPDTRLGPWLFTVARNLHTSHCRSRLLEDSHAAGLLGLWPCGSPRPSPFEEAEASEAQRRIATALAFLPAAYREALLLVALEGLRPIGGSPGVWHHGRGHAPALEPCAWPVGASPGRRRGARADGTERGHDMTPPDTEDPMMANLGRLRPIVPDPSHAERVRARCHAQLGRRRRRWERAALLAESTRRVLAPAVLGGVCVIYLAALVGTVLRLRGAS